MKMAVAHGDMLPARPASFKNIKGWENLHVLASYLVGKMLTDGDSWVNQNRQDVATNMKAGMKFWEHAAKHGLGMAAAGMGKMLSGVIGARAGVPTDYAASLLWYTQAWGLCALPEAA